MSDYIACTPRSADSDETVTLTVKLEGGFSVTNCKWTAGTQKADWPGASFTFQPDAPVSGTWIEVSAQYFTEEGPTGTLQTRLPFVKVEGTYPKLTSEVPTNGDLVRFTLPVASVVTECRWSIDGRPLPAAPNATSVSVDRRRLPRDGNKIVRARYLLAEQPGKVFVSTDGETLAQLPATSLPSTPPAPLLRAPAVPTEDQALWVTIRNRAEAKSFTRYQQFIDAVMCCTCGPDQMPRLSSRGSESRVPFPGVDGYALLKVATQMFLMQECGVAITTRPSACVTVDPVYFDEGAEEGRLGRHMTELQVQDMRARYLDDLATESGQQIAVLPYLKTIREQLEQLPIKEHPQIGPSCYGILRSKMEPCLLELIWSYWHEEGMLVQSVNAIARRFQNRRGPAGRDPLANVEIDPLRPLNNLLWGYVQDEPNRLSVLRRAYEYDHHYGLRLFGKAVPELQTADTRSQFLSAFHNLLRLTWVFFKEDDNTMVVADAFPVLNALKELHVILAEGAHNQFGDLPWTARVEMMIEQWLLARPEFGRFLGGRAMVPYAEPWMERVDTMKQLQGWSNGSVRDFRTLAVCGEQLLLAVRYGNWSNVIDRTQAGNWARYWRPEIQAYAHAYRAVTGVDVTAAEVDATLPAVHIRRRLAQAIPA